MRRARFTAAALALCATAVAGCGLGPGKDEGDVTLTVTRDYGRRVLTQQQDSIKESDTVLRVLDRNADISTRYGGGFVQSIDGLAGGSSGGRRSDWFFYVNGIESPIGGAQYDLSEGDRIWWDYRDWTAAMRVPAVVGSWPEPFVHGFQGNRYRTSVQCAGGGVVIRRACRIARERLEGAGATLAQGEDENGAMVLVGAWPDLAARRVVRPLSGPPDQSGVFARFIGTRQPLLELENPRGQSIGVLGKGGGLVAALRPDDAPPVWVITGTDPKAVQVAAAMLGPRLHNRYALATQTGAGPIGVPVP